MYELRFGNGSGYRLVVALEVGIIFHAESSEFGGGTLYILMKKENHHPTAVQDISLGRLKRLIISMFEGNPVRR